jgi:DNA mismatch repair ATPase MutS
MKVHLMYRERDFDQLPESLSLYPFRDWQRRKLLPNEDALMQDLELDTLFNAMAGDDKFLYHAAKQAVLSGLENDAATILYRQAVLKDCLRNYAVVKNIYDLAVEVIENKQRKWWGVTSKLPSSILYGSVELLNLFADTLVKLRRIADEHSSQFESEGFTALLAMLKAELSDEYLAEVRSHLRELKFNQGVLLSAELGEGNQGTNYVLHKSDGKKSWFERIFTRRLPAYSFRIHPRDEVGARILGELKAQGINLVANAAAQSSDHILSFFVMLRAELAFYLACVNLQRELARKSVPTCLPVPAPLGTRRHSCVELRDVCLVLSTKEPVVGNEIDANGKQLCIITGANRGGKSTFLRGIGLAQLMMQAGMFVAAESFTADICRNLFTHYKREEDTTMESGKFDEELKRMSDIADALTPNSLVLFNESFAATNEREGSEIARQIVRALLETRVKIFFVTHQYGFAHGLNGDATNRVLFLRAERRPDGTRTYKLLPGEPLETSFGGDLYKVIFREDALVQDVSPRNRTKPAGA